MSRTLAIHWIATTFGTWLHGDPRGSWKTGKLIGPDPFLEESIRERLTTDSVVLSPELQLIQEAAKVAAAMPNIRQDVVDAMKAELAAGHIGNDPHALADALINSSLANPKP